jgi:hypothetical protein
MPDQPNKSANDDATLAVPGVLCVSPTPSGQKVIHVGPSAGWMAPLGIAHWERELLFMARSEMTSELARTLHATLPHEQIAHKRFAMVARAVEASPMLALANNLAEGAQKEGARVHTIGIDRVSADFYYFAEGGPKQPVRVQGNLVEILAPVVNASTTNAEIGALLANLLDRLLPVLSEGAFSELDVELADALPRLSRDGTGLVGTDLAAFEAQAKSLAERSAHHGTAAREIADTLAVATREGQLSAWIPLYGEARREGPASLEVCVMGKSLHLPSRSRWIVTGAPRDRVVAPGKPPPHAIEARPAPTGSAGRPEAARQSAIVPAPAAESPVATAAADGKVDGASQGSPVVAPERPGVLEPREPEPVAVAALQPVLSAPSAAAGRRRSAKRSPWVPVLLLLALAMCLYFLLRTF